MSARRVIAVLGATGAQGGGLARAILGDPASAYAVRALVRDARSAKAQALARAGAELIQADLADAASVTPALQGAYGAFFVAFYRAPMSPEREKTQIATMARAAKAAKLQHVVWSTREDSPAFMALEGKSNPRFGGLPTTFLLTSAYWENLIYLGMGPKRGADGRLAIGFPTGDKKIPWIGAEDIGRCAYGIFKAGRSMIGKTIGVSGEHLSGRELAASLSCALGEPVDYIALKPEQYPGFPGADENERYRAARDVNAARELNPSLQRFDDWLRDNARRIPL